MAKCCKIDPILYVKTSSKVHFVFTSIAPIGKGIFESRLSSFCNISSITRRFRILINGHYFNSFGFHKIQFGLLRL